jgi:hypothetical protein
MSNAQTLYGQYGNIDRDYAVRLARRLRKTARCGGQPHEYREVADYGASAGPTVSGREADDIYAPLESLAALSAGLFLAS